MDLELSAHFLRARLDEAATPGESAGSASPVMKLVVERLADHPAVVFSRFGEVLAQTRPAIALFGDHARLGGSSRHLVESICRHGRRGRYRHPRLGVLELCRQLLVDPSDHQILLVLTATAGSASEDKLRLLAATERD